MPISLSISTTTPLMVVVEDILTRDYLRALWGSPIDADFHVGGGNEGVKSIVDLCHKEGYPNVVGVLDRDYSPTSVPGWFDQSKTFRTFVLPVHEIENYLLDPWALAASRYHNRGLDVTEIEARMATKAADLCWWTACRETVAELKRRFREPFIPDPSQSIVDEITAREYICESVWFKKLGGEAARSTESDVHTLLAADHAVAVGRLADGTWRREFTGKELYHDVAGWMCDMNRISGQQPSRADFFADVAKGVAAWQESNDAIPLDLWKLSIALRVRIGLISLP